MPDPNSPANVFVLGDLVLDHLIPVVDKRGDFHPRRKERVVEGRARKTFAGGAANCARLLAALSAGRTCLWGLSGYSPWGSFPKFLRSNTTATGGAGIIYYGAHAESHPMSTITRIVYENQTGRREIEYRIDDLPTVPVTESQARDAIGYLRAEAQEHGVHAVILNDLNMKALNAGLVGEIGAIAEAHRIPVFVDPKRDWSLFRHIAVTCVFPNLEEWCHLVGDAANQDTWRRNLDDPESLRRMAVRSLRSMPNARFHVVKCDRDGSVLISPDASGHHLIWRVAPHPVSAKAQSDKLGAGDVFVAAFAIEFVRSAREKAELDSVQAALRRANEVVACYLDLEWQQVPDHRELERFQSVPVDIVVRASVSDGVLLLPSEESRAIDLGEHAVHGSDLVSIDDTYRSTIDDLVAHFTTGWTPPNLDSAILTGRGGVGKTEICAILKAALEPQGIEVWRDFKCIQGPCPDIASAVHAIHDHWATLPGSTGGLVVILDEAFSNAAHLLLGEKGKMLLQLASDRERPTRFLFIDADFHRHREGISKSQFMSRCVLLELPAIDQRYKDVAYIFAAGCLKAARGKASQPVLISEAALIAVVNWVLDTPLEDQSPRNIVKKAGEAVAAALRGSSAKGALRIRKQHLSPDVLKSLGPIEGNSQFLEFGWYGS